VLRRRTEHVVPTIPESYRARLRCSKCGGRGAGILIGWWSYPSDAPLARLEASTRPAGSQVV